MGDSPGSIPGLGRSRGEGNSYSLQYSCLENTHGQRSLAEYSPWGRKEPDMTERLSLSVPHTVWSGPPRWRCCFTVCTSPAGPVTDEKGNYKMDGQHCHSMGGRSHATGEVKWGWRTESSLGQEKEAKVGSRCQEDPGRSAAEGREESTWLQMIYYIVNNITMKYYLH